MNKQPLSRLTIGVIIAAILIGFDTALPWMHQAVTDGNRYLPRLIITFISISAATIYYGRQSGAESFAEIFNFGFRTTILVAFLVALYTFIAVKWIYPAPSAAEMQAAVKAIESSGSVMHAEAIQQAAGAAANRWILYVSLSIFTTIIPGLIAATIGALLTKKNR